MDALAWSGTTLAYIGPGGPSGVHTTFGSVAFWAVMLWFFGLAVVFATLEVRWRGKGRETAALAAWSVTAALAFTGALLTLLVPFGFVDTYDWSGNEWLRPWALWFALLGFVASVSGAASWSLARSDGAPSVLRSLHPTQILVGAVVFPALGAATIGTICLMLLDPMLETRLLLLGALASLWLMGLSFIPIECSDPTSSETRHAMRLGVVTHAGVSILLTWIAITFTTGVPWGSIGKATAGWVMALLLLGACGRLQVWRPSPIAASTERK